MAPSDYTHIILRRDSVLLTYSLMTAGNFDCVQYLLDKYLICTAEVQG